MNTNRISQEKRQEIATMFREVYASLDTKGYRAVNQLMGYIFTEDPTYITTYENARQKISAYDHEELLQCVLEVYLGL